MRCDSNGKGNLQWFGFRMKNACDFTGTIKIVIVNFTKSKSLFQRGMQPSFWSYKQNKKDGRGWYQDGHNISYVESDYTKDINDVNQRVAKHYH